MSENSPIKDALYAKIEDIGQEQIHQLLLSGKFLKDTQNFIKTKKMNKLNIFKTEV